MSKRSILFVNQTPNRMLNDIALVYKQHGWETCLFCGSLPPAVDGFSEIIRGTAYNRSGFAKRLKTWWKFTVEFKKHICSKSKKFNRFFLVSNPPFILYLGAFLKKNNPGAEVDLLVYDLYPDVLRIFTGNFSNFLLKPLGFYNKLKFSAANRVFTPSDTLSKTVHRYYKGTVRTVYNWVDVQHIQTVKKEENKFLEAIDSKNTFNVLYSGNLGKTHDALTIIETAQGLNTSSIRFIMIGHGAGMEKIEASAREIPSIKVYGLQPEELFPHSIAAGDVALISYKDGAEGYSIPSKLPYYFAAGSPVIMIGNTESGLAKLIRLNRLGWCVPNHRHDELIRLLKELSTADLSSYKQRVREFVRQNWSESNAQLFYHE